MYDYVESNASIIRINRGDTYRAPLFINVGTWVNPVRYDLQPEDKLYFGVMEPNKLWEQSILRQIYTTENSEFSQDVDIYIKIAPEETEFLRPGKYYYMVKLVRYMGENKEDEIITVIPHTLFYVL